MPITTLSGTSSPASMYFLASRPIWVWFLTAARRMSPVEMWGMPYSATMRPAWVPLPAPGRSEQDEIELSHAVIPPLSAGVT